jgi:hypothetical protein
MFQFYNASGMDAGCPPDEWAVIDGKKFAAARARVAATD